MDGRLLDQLIKANKKTHKVGTLCKYLGIGRTFLAQIRTGLKPLPYKHLARIKTFYGIEDLDLRPPPERPDKDALDKLVTIKPSAVS